MVATLTDLSFGPEGQFGDLYSRMLKEAPESAKKFFPERPSDRKIRFEFAVVLQAVDDGGKITIFGWRRRGTCRWLPSFSWVGAGVLALLHFAGPVVVVPAPLLSPAVPPARV